MAKVRKKSKPVEKKKSKFQDLMDTHTPEIILAYGRNGTGKTSLASTLPKPILFLDIKDKGTESLKVKGVKKGDIIIINVDEFDDVYDAIDEAKAPTQIDGKYGSIVADHLTSLTELARQKIMREEGKSRMTQQLHGFAGEAMKDFITEFKDLADEGIVPMFIAQDRTEKGDGDGDEQLMPENGPGVPPGVSKFLCATVRIIGQTYIAEQATPQKNGSVEREIQYRFRVGPNPYYITKVTGPKDSATPQYIVDPTYEKIQSVVEGTYVEEKPKKARKTRSKRKGK